MKATIAKKIVRHVLTLAGGAGFATDNNVEQLAAAASFIIGLLWSLWEIKAEKPKPPGVTVTLFLLASLLILPGCAKFSGYTEREYAGKDLVKERVHFRGYTFLDSKSALAKAKSLQTAKTQSVGVDASDQESSGKSIVEAIEKLPAAIKAATVPPVIP